jgi:hypothetical protein
MNATKFDVLAGNKVCLHSKLYKKEREVLSADEQKAAIIEAYLRNKNKPKITENTKLEDLIQFSWLKNKKKWKHNRRLHKKFCKHWMRYVPQKIINSYLAYTFATHLRRRLDYSSMARRMFSVEQLPAGALPIYDRDVNL